MEYILTALCNSALPQNKGRARSAARVLSGGRSGVPLDFLGLGFRQLGPLLVSFVNFF